jgi:hypothetical protein
MARLIGTDVPTWGSAEKRILASRSSVKLIALPVTAILSIAQARPNRRSGS